MSDEILSLIRRDADLFVNCVLYSDYDDAESILERLKTLLGQARNSGLPEKTIDSI